MSGQVVFAQNVEFHLQQGIQSVKSQNVTSTQRGSYPGRFEWRPWTRNAALGTAGRVEFGWAVAARHPPAGSALNAPLRQPAQGACADRDVIGC